MLGTNLAKTEADIEAGLSDTREAVCTGIDWANRVATVNLYGSIQTMPWVGEPPWAGDRVRVVLAGQKPFCVASWGAALGTVVSVASNLATVTGDDGVTYTYPYSSGATVTAGFRVVLDHAHRKVGERISAEPTGSTYDVPTAPPSPGKASATFYPIDSGNFRNGTFSTNYVEISTTRSAAYWFNTQIVNTIPNSATVTRMEVTLRELWDQVPGTPTQMGTHTQATRGGEPAISGTVNVNDSGVYSILGFAAALQTGAALGLGFRKNTGYRRYDTSANSGSIYAEWSI